MQEYEYDDALPPIFFDDTDSFGDLQNTSSAWQNMLSFTTDEDDFFAGEPMPHGSQFFVPEYEIAAMLDSHVSTEPSGKFIANYQPASPVSEGAISVEPVACDEDSSDDEAVADTPDESVSESEDEYPPSEPFEDAHNVSVELYEVESETGSADVLNVDDAIELFDCEHSEEDDLGAEFEEIDQGRLFYYEPEPIEAPVLKRAREEESAPSKRIRTEPSPLAGLRTQPLEHFVNETELPYGRGFMEFVRDWADRFAIGVDEMRQRISTALQVRPAFRYFKSEVSARNSISRYFNINNMHQVHYATTIYQTNDGYDVAHPTTRLNEITFELATVRVGGKWKTVSVMQYLRWLASHHMEVSDSTPLEIVHPVLLAFRGIETDFFGIQELIFDASSLQPVSRNMLSALNIEQPDDHVARGFVSRVPRAAHQYLKATLIETELRLRPKIELHLRDHLIIVTGNELEFVKFQLVLLAKANEKIKNPTFRRVYHVDHEYVLDIVGVAAAVCEWCVQQPNPSESVASLFLLAVFIAFSEHSENRNPFLQSKLTVMQAFDALSKCSTLESLCYSANVYFNLRSDRRKPGPPLAMGVHPAPNHVHAFNVVCASGAYNLPRMQYLLGINREVCASSSCNCRFQCEDACDVDSLEDIAVLPDISLGSHFFFLKPRLKK